MSTIQRFTIATLLERIEPLIGKPYNIPRTTNKGIIGHVLETLVGIPHSPACLDCIDGELKAFPLKKTLSGYAPKETVAITMCNPNELKTISFEESRCKTKLNRVLFVPYTRQNDVVMFFKPCLFTSEHPLFSSLCEDYNIIQSNARENIFTGSIGIYLQTRTKGAGHGSTSRAFYLRQKFLTELFGKFTE